MDGDSLRQFLAVSKPGVQRVVADATSEAGLLKRLLGLAKIRVTRKKGA